jgi:Rad3-related DNA helicase
MKHPSMTVAFPRHIHPDMKRNQAEALAFLETHGAALLELPTGSGKTAIGLTYLRAHESTDATTLFYLVPNKTLAGQVKAQYPEVSVVYGRNEHPCLFYPDEDLKADEVPCSYNTGCPHRVNQETGETFVKGVVPCPYLQQKYEARQGKIVVATFAFYLFAVYFNKQWEDEGRAVVVDEAHRLAESLRSVLSFEITDYQLRRAMETLSYFADADTMSHLEAFEATFLRTVKSKPSGTQVLLDQTEIAELLMRVERIQPNRLRDMISRAVREGAIDPVRDRESLYRLEAVTLSLGRYLRSLQYSVKTEERNALNYTFAYWETDRKEGERIQHRLVVKAYMVTPLVRNMLPEKTLAMSATVSDPETFAIENGIRLPFLSLTSDWPHANTRIFMPTDTPNLATNIRDRQGVSRKQNPREKSKALRKVAEACKRLGNKGIRSLVIVVSNQEREKFLEIARGLELDTVSYNSKLPPRDAVVAFKSGAGTVLVGTGAHYGEGVDLPDGTAPVTFVLRPGYPNPDEPGARFEEARFGKRRWAVWQWRVIVQALQVRGRNVRSVNDKGVTIFVSQQFRNFVVHSLPKWLQPAYQGQKTLEECLAEAESLLLSKVEA